MIKIGSDNLILFFSSSTGLLNKIIADGKEIMSKINFIKYGIIFKYFILRVRLIMPYPNDPAEDLLMLFSKFIYVFL